MSVVAQQGRTHFVHLLAQGKNGATQANLTNNGVYFFKNKYGSNQYLDVQDASPNPHGNVQCHTFNGSKAQQWKALKISEGVYEFAPMVNQTLRLDVVNADDANGTDVQTYPKTAPYYAQQFLYVKRTDGSHSFIPRCAPDSYLAKSTSDSNVHIWRHGGGREMRWVAESAGAYRSKPNSLPNCLGYSLFLNVALGLTPLGGEDLAESTLTKDHLGELQATLNAQSHISWRKIGAYNSPIESNEYRIAFRAPRYVPWHGLIVYNFHVIYQLSDGTWAGKDDDDPSQHFGSGNPSTTQSMWGNHYPESAGTEYYAIWFK